MEILEVRGKTVEVALAYAMNELGIAERDDVQFRVLQEPEKGFLGLGGQDAIIEVRRRPEGRRRRRRTTGPEGSSKRPSQKGKGRSREEKSDKDGANQKRPAPSKSRNGKGSDNGRSSRGGVRGTGQNRDVRQKKGETVVPIEDHIPVVREFLEGLVKAFGLEGTVKVRAEDETVIADVEGSQTEAMVGPRGSVIEAIHELTKTVMHRKNQSTARLRLDVAGYGSRRREALSIYAHQLIDQVENDGGEIMLEPMSAADRKVVHDAVAERGTVRSYSEGVAPQRYVVIGKLGEAEKKDSNSVEEETDSDD